ncbi:hypothetical protein [Geobacter sp. SVR]|uniref:hypothetical protein n=1 Tax=Geobacter sp. SVR TaxID=2495594 RepID=UPI00143EFD46|nr:hypothetical protein [Geobacter sp. SVR]BCS52960.1 hypothetical protein GSVR_12680 [Geobacter sp. SVR]GCF84344.1 hypothetical protein GSbR_09440 [Geobacter sp. SVR]
MRKSIVFLAMLALVIAAPATLPAKDKVEGEVVMAVGNKVNLFHSGTADVKKEICINDVIPVFREYGGAKNPRSKEVGQVKVLSYAGEHYFEGEVVKGEVKPGDVAKKTGAACLIQPYRQ